MPLQALLKHAQRPRLTAGPRSQVLQTSLGSCELPSCFGREPIVAACCCSMLRNGESYLSSTTTAVLLYTLKQNIVGLKSLTPTTRPFKFALVVRQDAPSIDNIPSLPPLTLEILQCPVTTSESPRLAKKAPSAILLLSYSSVARMHFGGKRQNNRQALPTYPHTELIITLLGIVPACIVGTEIACDEHLNHL